MKTRHSYIRIILNYKKSLSKKRDFLQGLRNERRAAAISAAPRGLAGDSGAGRDRHGGTVALCGAAHLVGVVCAGVGASAGRVHVGGRVALFYRGTPTAGATRSVWALPFAADGGPHC